MGAMIEPSTFFNVLSDQTRLRILMLLQQEGELCVCEIMHALEASQPKVSRHLAYMRRMGCVSCRREGLWMHYRINGSLPVWTNKIITNIQSQLQTLKPVANDAKRLRSMSNRPQGHCA